MTHQACVLSFALQHISFRMSHALIYLQCYICHIHVFRYITQFLNVIDIISQHLFFIIRQPLYVYYETIVSKFILMQIVSSILDEKNVNSWSTMDKYGNIESRIGSTQALSIGSLNPQNSSLAKAKNTRVKKPIAKERWINRTRGRNGLGKRMGAIAVICRFSFP